MATTPRDPARHPADPSAPRTRRQRGMTLIEILVVLTLIGIIMGIVGGNFIGKGEKAKADAAKIEIGQIGQTLDLYKLETGLYPRLATQMILVGEESGRLEEMLTRVAEVYDREVQVSIKRFLAVLEPTLILSLAVMIGGIVFSILLGVMGMSELVS